MICQITDIVDGHFCQYLWHFPAVCLYCCTWQRLQAESWHCLATVHVELSQDLCYVESAWNWLHFEWRNSTLTGGRPVNKPLHLQRFCENTLLSFEHLRIVIKCCLIFELEYIYIFTPPSLTACSGCFLHTPFAVYSLNDDSREQRRCRRWRWNKVYRQPTRWLVPAVSLWNKMTVTMEYSKNVKTQ